MTSEVRAQVRAGWTGCSVTGLRQGAREHLTGDRTGQEAPQRGGPRGGGAGRVQAPCAAAQRPEGPGQGRGRCPGTRHVRLDVRGTRLRCLRGSEKQRAHVCFQKLQNWFILKCLLNLGNIFCREVYIV